MSLPRALHHALAHRGTTDVETIETSPSTVYDLIANVVHESTAGTARDKSNTAWKVQLRAGKVSGGLAEDSESEGQDEKWFQIQDLIVEELQKEMIFLGETVLQVRSHKSPFFQFAHPHSSDMAKKRRTLCKQ